MAIALESMAVEMPEVIGHPNRRAFRGVLTTVDSPSQQPPWGAKGHRVLLTKRAAEAALPSLLGMALDYSPSLDRHDVRRKVGVITRAEIVGRNLEVGGHLFARDFPEIVKEIAKASRNDSERSLSCAADHRTRVGALQATIACMSEAHRLRAALRSAAEQIRNLTAALRPCSEIANRPGPRRTIRAEARLASGAAGLGLSYEVADVHLADASARVWTLDRVTFTGAAILRRDKAAYRDTWIELGV